MWEDNRGSRINSWRRAEEGIRIIDIKVIWNLLICILRKFMLVRRKLMDRTLHHFNLVFSKTSKMNNPIQTLLLKALLLEALY